MNIMLGKDYSVNIMLNALPSSQLNWNIGHKPTYHIYFVVRKATFPTTYSFISNKTMALTCTDCFSRLFHYITVNATSYNAGIVTNAQNNNEIISVKLKITHSLSNTYTC